MDSKPHVKWFVACIFLFAAIIVLFASMCLGSFLGAIAYGDDFDTMICTAKKAHYVNVRVSPNSSARDIGEVWGNETICPSYIKDGWACIEFKGQIAYVKAEYFIYPLSPSRLYVVSSDGRVKVRDSVDGDFSRFVENGDEVMIEGITYDSEDRAWAKIESSREYIMVDFLKGKED